MKTRGWPDGEVYQPPSQVVHRRGTYVSYGPYCPGLKRTTPVQQVAPKLRKTKFLPLLPKSLPSLAIAALSLNPIQREPDGSLDVAKVILSRFVKHQHRNGKFAYALRELPDVWLFRPYSYSVAQRKVQRIIRKFAK